MLESAWWNPDEKTKIVSRKRSIWKKTIKAIANSIYWPAKQSIKHSKKEESINALQKEAWLSTQARSRANRGEFVTNECKTLIAVKEHYYIEVCCVLFLLNVCDVCIKKAYDSFVSIVVWLTWILVGCTVYTLCVSTRINNVW